MSPLDISAEVAHEVDSERYFVKFRETNDLEGESWNFWLQLDGNEEQLNKLSDLLDADEYEESFSVDMKNAIPESEVDILVKHSESGYMHDHNKVTGKFELPESTGDYDDDSDFYIDVFYKGGIKDYFKD